MQLTASKTAPAQKGFFLLDSVLNSYAQIFFTKNRITALLVLLATLLNPYLGVPGLLAVLVTNGLADIFGFDRHTNREGLYGLNSLLVVIGLSYYYEFNLAFGLVVLLACILTLFLSVALMQLTARVGLPFLSAPFMLALWITLLAIRQYQGLVLNDLGTFWLNWLFGLGGLDLVEGYEALDTLPIPTVLAVYLKSLAAILFQGNVLSGLLIAGAILWSSRISFTLSLLGFLSGYTYYYLVGADFTQLNYSYIGFNFILSAIAIGGFFFIPSWKSYLLVIITAPVTAILIAASSSLLAPIQLPVYALPFILIVWLLIYVSYFQHTKAPHIIGVLIQRFSPEKNLYAHRNYQERFAEARHIQLALPFFGAWHISQGHNGQITHRQEWRHAWDFDIRDHQGKSHREPGLLPQHFYCYQLPVLAPADGTVVKIIDGVPDNEIGEVNLKENWGNTIILKHAEQLYTQLSHLQEGSFQVEEGQQVKQGEVLAQLGNSGRSPEPHLHLQVQATPYVGSQTLEYPLSHYLIKQDEKAAFISFGFPEEGQTVFNSKPASLLQEAMNLVPGKKLIFKVEDSDGKLTGQAVWDVLVDPYNQSYLHCTQTGSYAYFMNDEAQHYFTSFKGSRKSLLFYFYLASYKILLSDYAGLELTDKVPLFHIVPAGRRFLQDFLAPFYQYQHARFRLKYPEKKEDPQEEQLQLNGQVTQHFFRRTEPFIRFKLDFQDHTLQGFTIQRGGREIRAVQPTD